ncbi:restriction endonuclease subunit S [Pseudomonas sp. MWU13-2100]|uniref:restriction endonuclease subunit S n=1 Tax=Pseudomonas sp. MWU13-2100 TaxID=2935075 RepID=UPI00200D73F2|nr:restriction endonuclease subunit S [Pseudomonas sp. MWU13-2100]
MSRLDKLIAELCPEGVEFNSLGCVAAYSDTRVDASSLDETTFVGVDNLLSNTAGKTDASYQPNTARLSEYKVGDILLGNIRPYLKKIWLANNSGGCSGDVLVVRILEEHRQHLLPEFLYRLLSSDDFFTYSMQHAKGAKMPRGSKEAILKYRIPVPPLEVQREIVEILVTFTKLEAELSLELEAELEARRRQYDYYRNALLAFGDQDVRWAVMAEVGEFFRGRRFTKNDFDVTGVACIHYGDIYKDYGTATTTTVSYVRTDMVTALRFAQPGDLVIAGVGETVEDVGKAVAWLGKGEVAIHDDCFAFRHSLNPKFVAHYFQTAAFHTEKNKFVARAKVKRLSKEGLGKLSIPVPPPEEQARIVAILDKFEALVSDLSIGLPAELKTRRQQYVHYRDRLLTFREVA